MLTKNEIKDDPSDLFVETSISYMFSTWVGSASVNQIIHSIARLSVFFERIMNGCMVCEVGAHAAG